ncbi:DUF2892 domain-containing protein [candidate division KSB1 bacterium]|nr:DUF2892 domain-containing protein [candidate division KSB1 bacterium]NIR69359.1 DUF2892 domain-containing protein [candidate division KSB1 bacterium]NIS24177.1 DUF2892 domain-containing protein [candidate division KSB1 bacterium]NIT71092.1 DUF2892 domain-containing protein [candidate division KSB1 bacterium]NIU24796.1 DUF2892 domain-containing protein [candidate division KSB1 bacterium]
MGTLDRAIRTILGLGLLSLVFIGPKTLWGITGVVPIATAIIGYCPPYKWLGINTRRRRKNTARK